MSDNESVYPWRMVRSEEVMRCPVFSVDRRHMVEDHPDTNKAGDFYVLQAPDWVNVLALTVDDDLLLIQQWRQGLGAPTWEIPGGMVDPGENAAVAACRELREETGYVADRWFQLGSVTPNPALQSNRCTTFLALDCRREGAPQFDGNERIRVSKVPYRDVPTWVIDGRIHHALVIAALHWEALRRGGTLDPRAVEPSFARGEA